MTFASQELDGCLKKSWEKTIVGFLLTLCIFLVARPVICGPLQCIDQLLVRAGQRFADRGAVVSHKVCDVTLVFFMQKSLQGMLAALAASVPFAELVQFLGTHLDHVRSPSCT